MEIFMRTDNAGNARRRAGGDWMTALCAAVFNAIRACAGTMLWMLAVVWSWHLVWPLFALVPLLAAGVVLGVSHVLPDGPRRVVRWLLPVIGDVDRWRVRHARCLGNRWLRDTGLIRDSAGRRAVRYRVFLWPDRLVIDRLPVVGVTGETLRRALAGSSVPARARGPRPCTRYPGWPHWASRVMWMDCPPLRRTQAACMCLWDAVWTGKCGLICRRPRDCWLRACPVRVRRRACS